jgi:hypothetical protein
VWRTEGAVRKGAPDPQRRLRANRWALTADDVLATLGYQGEVPLLQSWGLAWPHRVWVADEFVAWHLARDGEAGVPSP